MYKLFISGLATVATDAIVTFGPEKITCNALTPNGDLMVSGLIPPFKTTLTVPQSIIINLEEEITMLGDEVLPDELVLQYHEGVLYAFPDVDEADIPDEIMIFEHKCVATSSDHPEPPRINYPLRFSIDTEALKGYIHKLNPSKDIIMSYENGPMYLADGSWKDKVEIPGTDFFITRLTRGSYSSLFDRDLLESVINSMELFESVSIALGEDLPLIVVGIDPNLKLGYMIAQQV
jgi:hypothetical protein